MSPGADLTAALDRVRRRLRFALGLTRAAWLLVAGVISVELAALAARGLGDAALLFGGALGSALALAALAALALTRRPSRANAARSLDLALGRGGLVEAAAEALDGKHGAFAPLVLGEASSELARRDLARLAPIEAPRGIALGGAASLLLLALVLGPATQAPAEEARLPAIGVAPAENGPGSSGPKKKGDDRLVAVPVKAPGPAVNPALPPEVARALEARLREVENTLANRPPVRGPSSGSPGEPGEEKKAVLALERALAKGDEKAAMDAIDALEAAGSAASSEAVRRAADALARAAKPREAGTGAGAGGGTPGAGNAGSPSRVPGGAGSGGEDAARTAGPRPSWRVREAERRYKLALE